VSPSSLPRGWKRRRDLRKNGRAALQARGSVNHLTGLRGSKAHFAGQAIDATRPGHFGFTQAQLAILFPQLIQGLLFRFDAIRTLDGAEVLEAVNHHQRKQERDSG
jgi:hypothetical protein